MLRRYRLALSLWICGIAMVFVAFLSASIVRRGLPAYEIEAGAYSTQWEPLSLPIPLLILNLCTLVACCLSLELARRRSRAAATSLEDSAPQNAYPWLCASIALALAFIAGQLTAWRVLRAEHEFVRTGARAAFFYLLTGVHGTQIMVGVLVLGWMVIRQGSWTTTRRYIALDLATWYFSAMAVLWIVLFCFLVFA